MAPHFKICRRENLGKYQECFSSPESQFNFERSANNEVKTCSVETPFSSDEPKRSVQIQKDLQIQCQCQCHEYSLSLDSLEKSQLYVLIMKYHLLSVRCDEIKKTSRHENYLHQPAQSEERPGIGVGLNSGTQPRKYQPYLQPAFGTASTSNENNNQCVVQTAGPQFGETEASVKQKQFYSCKFCPKMFGKKCHAIEHLRTHTGEKPFSCLICGKYFRTKSQVKQHGSVHLSGPTK